MMKFIIVFILSCIILGCDSNSPSEISSSAQYAASSDAPTDSDDAEVEAWISGRYEIGNLQKADGQVQVTGSVGQFADARLSIELNAEVFSVEQSEVFLEWRQIRGVPAEILQENGSNASVILPRVESQEVLVFQIIALTTSGIYAVDSVEVTVLPLPAPLSLAVSDTAGSGNGDINIRLLEPSESAVTLVYRTLDGSAVAGEDYQAASGTVNFPAGEVSATLPITILSGNGGEFFVEFEFPGGAGTTVYRVDIPASAGPVKPDIESCVGGALVAVNDPAIFEDFQLSLVDSLGAALANQEAYVVSSKADSFDNNDEYVSNDEGSIILPCVVAGDYRVILPLSESLTEIALAVSADTLNSSALITFPVRKEDNGELIEIGTGGLLVALSGVVLGSNQEPVYGAQVEISAGSITNGAIAAATTDEDGAYNILVNVGETIAPSLSNGQIRVVANGFEPVIINGVNLLQQQSITGQNFVLVAESTNKQIYYVERFDDPQSSASCANWTKEDRWIDYGEGIDPVNENLWHTHVANLNILNIAYDYGLVSLGPDDKSQGYVVDPFSGASCWFGDDREGGATQGNFLVEANYLPSDADANLLDGGKSTSPSGYTGSITSPQIDLTTTSPPISLSFMTWWEIESVNPNSSGYDLMEVAVLAEGEGDWLTLARLNPLSDPVKPENDFSLPYSNRGFNRAPAWLRQEPISLDAFAGKNIQIRFEFSTIDELYNGFRGWMIDDVTVSNEVGTFPLFENVETDF